MLQKQTISPETLDLLNRLQSVESLESFNLGGGTALALRYGHRMSIDLDFFSNSVFDTQLILEELKEVCRLDEFKVLLQRPKSLFLVVNNVKLDILSYEYAELNQSENIDSIKLLSEPDNICMKLSAVSNRGEKKDFYDVYEILKRYPLIQLLDWYQEKYLDNEVSFLVRSLTYFEDAENTPEPISLTGVSWDDVKENIRLNVSEFL